jgi:hypothetical protein
MRIISLNVGLPSAQRYEGSKVITAGAKNPVPCCALGTSMGTGRQISSTMGVLRRRCASTHSTTVPLEHRAFVDKLPTNAPR